MLIPKDMITDVQRVTLRHDYKGEVKFVSPSVKIGKRWIKVFEENFFTAAKALTPPSFSMLVRLMSLAKRDNYIFMNLADIADKLEIKKRKAANMMSELCKYNLVIKVRPYADASNVCYRINPLLYWRNNLQSLAKELTNLSKEQHINWKPYFDKINNEKAKDEVTANANRRKAEANG